MTTIFLSSSQNPDSESIAFKQPIDLSISLFDIEAAGETGSVQTNYSATAQVVFVDSVESAGSVYYTPIYKEQINYDEWLKRIDRNFQELN